jgi:hypothetical protein
MAKRRVGLNPLAPASNWLARQVRRGDVFYIHGEAPAGDYGPPVEDNSKPLPASVLAVIAQIQARNLVTRPTPAAGTAKQSTRAQPE